MLYETLFLQFNLKFKISFKFRYLCEIKQTYVGMGPRRSQIWKLDQVVFVVLLSPLGQRSTHHSACGKTRVCQPLLDVTTRRWSNVAIDLKWLGAYLNVSFIPTLFYLIAEFLTREKTEPPTCRDITHMNYH